VLELKKNAFGICSDLSAEIVLLGADLQFLKDGVADSTHFAGQLRIPIHEAEAFIRYSRRQKSLGDGTEGMRQALLCFEPEPITATEPCRKPPFIEFESKIDNLVKYFHGLKRDTATEAQKEALRIKAISFVCWLWPDRFATQQPHFPGRD